MAVSDQTKPSLQNINTTAHVEMKTFAFFFVFLLHFAVTQWTISVSLLLKLSHFVFCRATTPHLSHQLAEARSLKKEAAVKARGAACQKMPPREKNKNTTHFLRHQSTVFISTASSSVARSEVHNDITFYTCGTRSR